MTPGAGILALGCGLISHIVKMHYSLKKIFLYSPAWMRQIKYIVMMTKEGSTRIISFMTPGSCRTVALPKFFVDRPERHSAIHSKNCIFFAQKKLRTFRDLFLQIRTKPTQKLRMKKISRYLSLQLPEKDFK